MFYFDVSCGDYYLGMANGDTYAIRNAYPPSGPPPQFEPLGNPLGAVGVAPTTWSGIKKTFGAAHAEKREKTQPE